MVALHVCQVWWTLAYKPMRTRRHKSRRTFCQGRSVRARASIRLACFAGTCQILVESIKCYFMPKQHQISGVGMGMDYGFDPTWLCQVSSPASQNYFNHWLCTYIVLFSVPSNGATANRQIPDRIFWSLFASLMKDSVTNYGSILTLFPPSVRGLDVLYNTLIVSYFHR